MIEFRTRLLLLALFCAVVFFPRPGGMHLHLCLDGAAPAVYLHLSDAADSHVPDPDHGHDDPSIKASSPMLGKLSPQGFGGLLAVMIPLLVVVRRQLLLLLPLSPGVVSPFVPPFLRPQLRGPPA